jgi:hypothetical protein
MSNQLQITGGAKVRNLEGVLIGTSGVVSSLAINVPSGIPQLDGSGKILVSQLPNSVMEYKGTWNAATNTPTLVNGTGNQGDVYLCSVAGTVNFGAGAITFNVGDQVIYSGSIWQRASGATGTVTSVAVTESGDSLNITGSPITTSGTINIGFNGTNLQYINGAGDLTTFPTLLSSVGLSMPSAFNVSNSPLTANGTIGVTGAGVASQYIRGDGTLADFPTSGGGGGSVSYYLNGGTSQGVIGGITYYEMSKIAVIGTGVDFPKTGDGLIVSFLTDAGDPAQLNIPAGNWNYEIYASMSANGGTPQLYAELYVYDGTNFTLIGTSTNEILYDGTTLNLYTFAMAVPATTLAITDRLAVKLYSTNSGGKTTTVHTQDGHLCQIITTFSTGITALNGLTAQVQFFATGTSGTDFAISSSVATHTFNLPVASAANTGKLSSTDWSTFNGKVPYTGATADVDLGAFNFKANIVTIASAGGSNQLTSFANTNSLHSSSAGLNVFGFNTSNNIYFGKGLTGGGLGNGGVFIWNNTQVRYYTLPDADGTIALTSSLSSYLPLAGGTLTGALNGTSAVFSSTVQASAYRLTGMTGGSGALYWTSDRVTLANYNATGLVQIEANGGTSVAVFGGATYNSDFVGTGRFTGALTGTSASFSSTATATAFIPSGSTVPTNGMYLSAANTLNFATNTTNRITITSAGNVGIGTSSPNGNLQFATAVNTRKIVLFEGGNNDYQFYGFGVESNKLIYSTNGTSDDHVFFAAASSTTRNELMRIKGNGNVGIGTSSPNAITGTNLIVKAPNASGNGFVQALSSDSGCSVALYSGNFAADDPAIAFQKNLRFGAVTDSGLTGFSEKMRIASNGVVTINNIGSGAVTATSGVLSATSDMNLKISDGYIDTALDKILKLTPRYFYWKEETGLPTDLRQLGFYAQEVNEAIGEEGANTPKNENDKWGIYDRAIIAMLTKGMQEQNELIQDLKARLDNAGL